MIIALKKFDCVCVYVCEHLSSGPLANFNYIIQFNFLMKMRSYY